MDVLNSQVPDAVPPVNPGASFPVYQATPIAEPLTESLKPKKSHKLLITLLILFILLVVGAVFAYPLISSTAVIASLNRLDTAPKIKGKLTTYFISENTKLSSSPSVLQVELDRTNPASPSARLLVDAGFVYEAVMGSSLGNMEIRFVDNMGYVKSDMLNEGVSKTGGLPTAEWYSFGKDSLKTYSQGFAGGFYEGLGQDANSVPEIRVPQISFAKGYARLKEAGIIGEPTFKGIGSENGKLVRKYQFVVDRPALVKAILDSVPDNAGMLVTVAEVLEGVDFDPIVTSVSMFGSDIRRIDAGVSFTGNTKKVARGIDGINFSFENYPEETDFTIVAPQDALSLELLIKKSLEQAQMKAKSAGVQASLAAMRPALEIYFNRKSTYVGGCTSADVVPHSNYIKSYGFTFTCRSSTKAFLVAATGYDATTRATTTMCYDSTGQFKKLPKLAAGYSCK